MAPATTQEEGGEGSGSRSRAGRRLRRSHAAAGQSEPTSKRRRGAARGQSKGSRSASESRGAENSERMTRNTRASASASAARKKRSRRAGMETAPTRSKRSNVGDTEESSSSSAASATEQEPSSEPSSASASAARKKRSRAGGKKTARRRSEDAAAAAEASVSASTKQAPSTQSSSAVSSPIREPYIPRKVIGVDEWGMEIFEPFTNIVRDEEIQDLYATLRTKYVQKCRKHAKLLTLDMSVPPGGLRLARRESSRDSITEMVLKVARVVFGLSSSIDGKLLKRASGFLIDWDKESKMGTILTSAFLILSKTPSCDEWSGTHEYAPNAEVRVHLLDKDETYTVAELKHYDKHYNFALFKFKIDLDTQIPSFGEVEFAQDAVVLGRDGNMHLIVEYGMVPHMGPSGLERYHYMFAGGKPNKCAPGGPVVDLNGQFLGMINLPNMAFTPSTIILKCLDMLKKFHCIPRLQTGMKLSSIRFLGPVHREKIIRKFGIGKGLIVHMVSEGSAAEKEGIRPGDIVECWNGEPVSTTLELESLLLRMSEEHLDNGGCNGSNMNVPVGVFLVRKESRRSKTLTLKVGDGGEVIVEGKYAVTRRGMVSNDDANSGQEALVGGN